LIRVFAEKLLNYRYLSENKVGELVLKKFIKDKKRVAITPLF